MKPLEHYAAEIHRRLWAALESNLHDAPLHCRRFIIARDVIPSNHVHYNLGAIVVRRGFRGCNEVLSLIINGDIGAELAAGVAFLR